MKLNNVSAEFSFSGLHITHLLSLDALLAVVNVIALQCQEVGEIWKTG